MLKKKMLIALGVAAVLSVSCVSVTVWAEENAEEQTEEAEDSSNSEGEEDADLEESDNPEIEEGYINAKEEDIVIVKSPVGMPGRAIKNKFLERVAKGPVKVEHCFRCLEHCDPATTPYCITKALINAAEGKIDDALLFCGSNAYRCEKIETVPEVMAALCGE